MYLHTNEKVKKGVPDYEYFRFVFYSLFTVELHGKKYTIGAGEPAFEIAIHKDIPKRELLSSTSLALGEAYMRKDLEIKGDLFTALQCMLSQNNQFSLDKSALGRLL